MGHFTIQCEILSSYPGSSVANSIAMTHLIWCRSPSCPAQGQWTGGLGLQNTQRKGGAKEAFGQLVADSFTKQASISPAFYLCGGSQAHPIPCSAALEKHSLPGTLPLISHTPHPFFSGAKRWQESCPKLQRPWSPKPQYRSCAHTPGLGASSTPGSWLSLAEEGRVHPHSGPLVVPSASAHGWMACICLHIRSRGSTSPRCMDELKNNTDGWMDEWTLTWVRTVSWPSFQAEQGHPRFQGTPHPLTLDNC